MPFLQSISSWLNPGAASSSSRHQARRSVMDSTSDAFSLPTTAGRYPNGSGAGRDSSSSSPGPSRRNSGSYTSYPSSDAYQPSVTHYPPLSHTFHRLRRALAETFPEILETLNAPADPSLLLAFEHELGCPLPPPVRETYLISDGQDLDSANSLSSGGLFYGLYLLPLEEVMSEWAFWRTAEYDPLSGKNPAVLATMASVPPKWIKSNYANRGWIPLLSDRSGNYVGIDLDPGSGGAWGQVIVFGRDFDRKCVLWKGEGGGGWGKWLAGFVDDLESGEGYEADRERGSGNGSSDEDEEIGYGSYNGGNMSGEAGKGLRLAGEYKGWNVLEAWWDKSVRRWEELGLGMDVEEVEKGLSEARRLAGFENDKGKARDGLGIGMGVGVSVAQVEIPVFGSPQLPPLPSTPTPVDSDVLLPPSSPDHMPTRNPIPRIGIQQPQPSSSSSSSGGRTITPINTTGDHPLKTRNTRISSQDGYLSPPTRSPPRGTRHRVPLPVPTPLDLPTRADVQAMSAIARAEASGLRGGWVLHSEAPPASRLYSNTSNRRSTSREDEMVDIDLEGGKVVSRMSDVEMQRQREEEKLAIAGRLLNGSRTPSPLSRENSMDHNSGQPGSPGIGMMPGTPGASLGGFGGMEEATPKAPYYSRDRDRDNNNGISQIPTSIRNAGSALRKPPKIKDIEVGPNSNIRSRTPDDIERDNVVYRNHNNNHNNGDQLGYGVPSSAGSGLGRPRGERESSVVSVGSDHGLLERRSTSHSQTSGNSSMNGSGRGTPVLGSPVGSPRKYFSPESVDEGVVPNLDERGLRELEDSMEEISLERS